MTLEEIIAKQQIEIENLKEQLHDLKIKHDFAIKINEQQSDKIDELEDELFEFKIEINDQNQQNSCQINR